MAPKLNNLFPFRPLKVSNTFRGITPNLDPILPSFCRPVLDNNILKRTQIRFPFFLQISMHVYRCEQAVGKFLLVENATKRPTKCLKECSVLAA